MRIGTPAATTRGMGETEMKIIADCIYQTAADFEGTSDQVRQTVMELTSRFPIYDQK